MDSILSRLATGDSCNLKWPPDDLRQDCLTQVAGHITYLAHIKNNRNTQAYASVNNNLKDTTEQKDQKDLAAVQKTVEGPGTVRIARGEQDRTVQNTLELRKELVILIRTA